jgi:hypothetical protein
MILKNKLAHAPLLQLPNFNKSFKLKCEASGIGLAWEARYYKRANMVILVRNSVAYSELLYF